MLRTSKSGDSRSAWKVLIMDKITVKVMSCSCKMADITDEGVSLVEDLFRRRKPLPSMDAIYFIQPTKENIVMFLSDMSGREPLYKKAYVFFSSSVPKDLVTRIKNDTSVLPRIGALREMNLEYFSMDSQGFVTDHENTLRELYGDQAPENPRKFDALLNTMATRISTVFASLRALLVGTWTSASTTDWLLQELLKDKLQQWLSSRLAEGSDVHGCLLSKKEQGIIHMVSGLGYVWALNLILSAGVSVNFRDINGWTALHWAARFGREKMVAVLLASGASAGAVTDPTSQDPIRKNPASIAGGLSFREE